MRAWPINCTRTRTAAVAAARTEGEAGRAIELASAAALTNSEDGTPQLRYGKEEGFISVDGEWAHYGPLQVEILPAAARVFGRVASNI